MSTKTVKFADLRRDHGSNRFSTLSSLNGVEVIDNHTGHPVFRTSSSTFADMECEALNEASVAGPRVLAAALGAIEEDEV